MKHNYHERRENRINYAENQAVKNIQRSTELCNRSIDMLRQVPPGQPVLIGHHSEGSHRRLLDRSWNIMGASVQADKTAKYYNEKAFSIANNNAISSDNPDAISLLKKKLADLIAQRDNIKKMNAAIRKKNKEAFLKIPGATEEKWQSGHVHNDLNRSIKSVSDRISELEKIASFTYKEKEVKGIIVITNPEANRFQLKFPGRTSKEVYKQLRHYGFVYCHSEGVFQRKITGNGQFAMNQFLTVYTTES